MLFFLPPPPPHTARGGGGVLFDYSVNPVLPFEILNSQRVGIPSFHLWKVVWWGGVVVVVVVVCLIIVSTPGPDFAKVKARFGQVSDQVNQG